MSYDPRRHHRRSIRLPGYDYAQAGAYFVTIVAQGRICLFGDVVEGDMHLSGCGAIVLRAWRDLPRHYPYVALDAFVVMPNHIHGVILLADPPPNNVDGHVSGPPMTRRSGLPEIVRRFKSSSARGMHVCRAGAGQPVWQRGYYEHVIRDEGELGRIRDYICTNPLRWSLDRENPLRESDRKRKTP